MLSVPCQPWSWDISASLAQSCCQGSRVSSVPRKSRGRLAATLPERLSLCCRTDSSSSSGNHRSWISMKIFGSHDSWQSPTQFMTHELSWTLSNTTFMFNIQIVFIKTKDEYEIPRLNFKINYQLKIMSITWILRRTSWQDRWCGHSLRRKNTNRKSIITTV